ncbi:protein HGH1 homolog [Sceloporus undulatus]|uniref:protein HGH1 homolog n=1 Tax=Sceloporus undulatus TaxID=8520 RepID=UPI001C4CD661|nr:protein HGH1 homolog [Sceloporus undulatus]
MPLLEVLGGPWKGLADGVPSIVSLTGPFRATFALFGMDEQQTQELLGFLRPETRLDLKGRAVQYLTGLTGSPEGRQLLATQPEVVEALLALTGDTALPIAKEAYHALINLAMEPAAQRALAKGLPSLLSHLLDPASPLADQSCALLSNLSREEAAGRDLLAALQAERSRGLVALVDAFCAGGGFNPQASLHYLGPLLSNLSQLPEARQVLLDPSRCVVQRLLPFTQDPGSAVRRGGVVGTLRNCCFDYRCHEWLLSEEVDVLPFLLLPLAGPEDFPEDEMEKLPLDLQYLPPEKEREPDPDIRKMLLEAVMLLTATKRGRLLVREKGTYVILRELHKWETDPGVRAACEKLIQVLISDEPQPGMDNLLEVEIPSKVEEQLRRLDLEEKEEEERQRQQQQEEAAGSEGPASCAEGLRR